MIRNAALLHDIGKISIRNETLVKTEELTSREYEILKRHPDIAVNMLKDLKFLERRSLTSSIIMSDTMVPDILTG